MSDYDGLWVIEFKSAHDYGCGVLVFNGSQVMGGDIGYYYFGRIDTTENLSGEVNVVRFNPNINSVFGDADKFTLLLTDGTINKTDFKATASIKGYEGSLLEIKGRKKVDKDEAV